MPNPPKLSSKLPQIEIWSTINQWNFCESWMSSPPIETQSPPIDDFLATVLLSHQHQVQWRAEGGGEANGAPGPGTQGRGASKEWKYKKITDSKKVTSRFTQAVRITLLFFSSLSNFVAVRFVSLKKCTANRTSVLLTLLLLHSTFFKGEVVWNFWCFFLSGLFEKKRAFFGWIQLHRRWR